MVLTLAQIKAIWGISGAVGGIIGSGLGFKILKNREIKKHEEEALRESESMRIFKLQNPGITMMNPAVVEMLTNAGLYSDIPELKRIWDI